MSDIPKIKLSDLVERKRTEGAIEIELSDGSSLQVDPPELWSDKARKIAADPKSTDEDLGKELFGAEQWKKFLADGGGVGMFVVILQERFNMTAGESQASSSS
jgi:hypothetical protein